jgi:hypothetical protein
VRQRVQILRKYPWSSYRGYIGAAKPFEFVACGPILEMMGRPRKRQSALYRRFVESGISDIDAAFIEAKGRSRLCIGSDACHKRMQAHYRRKVQAFDKKEDVSFRRQSKARAVDDVLRVVCEVLQVDREALTRRCKDSMVRPVAARMLSQYGGLTQRQAAEIVGVSSGAAVCFQIRRLNERMRKDKTLRRRMAQIEKQLQQETGT